MLTRFELENYRGFGKRIVLDLAPAPDGTCDGTGERNGGVPETLLIGANGAGKTDLGLGLLDIVRTLTDGGARVPGNDDLGFLNADSCEPWATFVYELAISGRTVRYEYRKTSPDNIVYERLDAGEDTVFMRDGVAGAADYGGLGRFGAGRLRMDVPNGPLSVVRYVCRNTVQPEGSPLAGLMEFAEGMHYMGQWQDADACASERFIVDNGLVDDFRIFLRDTAGMDPGLESVDAGGVMGGLVLRGRHRSVRFGSVASSGTRALMCLYCGMRRLGDSGFLYADGLDAFHHRELTERICRMLLSRGGIQTVVATRDVSLLSGGAGWGRRLLLKDGSLEPVPGQAG